MNNYFVEFQTNLISEGFGFVDVGKIIEIAESTSKNFKITEIKTASHTSSTEKNRDVLNKFFYAKRVEGKSEKTIKTYSYILKGFFGRTNKAYDKIVVGDIRDYLTSMLKKGCATITVDTIRATIASLYQWLTAEGMIRSNPSSLIKPLVVKKELKVPFTDLEIDKLRKSCVNMKERMIVEVLLSSGMRVGEFVNVNLSDIELFNRRIFIKFGKGHKERWAYISDLAVFYIKQYLATRKDEEQYLCLGNGTKRISTGGVRYLIKELGNRAGVQKAHPHKFRRTLATTLVKRGMEVQKVQRVLGHSDMQTTMEYVYMEDSVVENSYKKCI